MKNKRLRWVGAIAAFACLVILCAGGAAADPPPRITAAEGLVPNFAVRGQITDAVMPYFGGAAVDPGRERLYLSFSQGPYLSDGRTLHVIDTRDAARLTTLSGPELDQLALSPDGSRLVGHTDFPSSPGDFRVYDTATLQPVADIPTTCAPTTVNCWLADMAVGPGGRLYWLAHNDTLLTIIDLATGEIVGHFPAAGGAPISEIEIAGDRLFVFESVENNPTPHLRRYHLAADALPLAELAAPLGYEREFWRASPDGTALLAGQYGGLVQFDGNTLQYVRDVMPQAQYGAVNAAFAPDGETFYVFAHHPSPATHYQQYLMNSYDTVTGVRRNTLQLDLEDEPVAGYANAVLPLAGGEVAIALPGQVNILHAMRYATALPLGLSNFCAAAVNDDFSQPASGWPSNELGTAAVGYESGEYFVRLTTSGLWFGVSRGDPWLFGSQIRITTRSLGNEGYSGLVFGIQPGWSEFYTFEVFPSSQQWAIFHYTAAGWEVVKHGELGLINPVGVGNTLSITEISPNDSLFRINGIQVTYLPNVDGRVGLSAGSLDEPFEARYDDYFFSGPNCPRPLRAGDATFAPPISRPPLETLLTREGGRD
jgi:hypothetical protein